jgi:hypothetical protein
MKTYLLIAALVVALIVAAVLGGYALVEHGIKLGQERDQAATVETRLKAGEDFQRTTTEELKTLKTRVEAVEGKVKPRPGTAGAAG